MGRREEGEEAIHEATVEATTVPEVTPVEATTPPEATLVPAAAEAQGTSPEEDTRAATSPTGIRMYSLERFRLEHISCLKVMDNLPFPPSCDID